MRFFSCKHLGFDRMYLSFREFNLSGLQLNFKYFGIISEQNCFGDVTYAADAQLILLVQEFSRNNKEAIFIG